MTALLQNFLLIYFPTLLVTECGCARQDPISLSSMNHLAKEQSAYLRSAAHQPVHWYPWGREAFDHAEKENKPVLLDIGAVWCHWCHVMDMESYENDSLAQIINELFVAVKVDRDERPDVDARYQAAVSAISGQGGWPLTAFLMPDGKAFYGGTYFPPEDQYGRVGFKKVLRIIAENYHKEHDKALQNAEEIDHAVRNYLSRQSEQTELNESLLDSVLSGISREYDIRHGGFGGAPKFPHPTVIELLLTRYDQTHEQWMVDAVVKTLHAMANGGVYDQLGGGFHRYSTDEKWIVPHFEKMLYDNAPLLKNYVHAYQATGDEFFKKIALDIIRYATTVLSDQERGGFYASQDADVKFGDDGSYFTWSLEDAQRILSPDELEVMKLRYNIYERGEMQHDTAQNVLFIDNEAEQISALLRKHGDEVQLLLSSGKRKIQAARMQRKAPFVDTTIYASWNGVMISAYLHAYRAFQGEKFITFGLKSLDRILAEHKSREGLITHRASVVASEAFLDDQVEVVQALLDAYEVSGKLRYREEAEQLLKKTIEFFSDKNSAGFTDTPSMHQTLGALQIKNKPIQDSPTAGANASAIVALLRLHTITEKSDYKDYAEKTLQYFAGAVKNYGIFAATYFLALDLLLNPPPHIVIVAKPGEHSGIALLQKALSAYRPNAMVSPIDPESGNSFSPTVQRMVDAYTKPVAYVCSDFVCSPPVYDALALVRTIKSFGRNTVVPR